MQKLLDVINKLSEKYKFSEEEINEIQQCVFEIENGDHELEAVAENFEDPYKSEDEDGLIEET